MPYWEKKMKDPARPMAVLWGAATKADEKTGVATQIKTIDGKGLYTHCSGHVSNLAVSDAIKSVQSISDSLDTIH